MTRSIVVAHQVSGQKGWIEMSDSTPRRRPDVMGGPDRPSDVLSGGREPVGEDPDVMESGAERPSDVLEGGREPAAEDPDVMEGGREPAAENPDVMDGRDE